MKKILILILTIAIVFGNTVSIFAQATPPTPPPAPTAPPVPTPPPAPTMPPVPTQPPVPTAPPTLTIRPTQAPTAPPVPTFSPTFTPNPTFTSTPTAQSEGEVQSSSPTPVSDLTQEVLGQTSDGLESDEGQGSATINTGDATTDRILVTDANSNLSAVLGDGSASGESVAIINSGNGVDSTNAGSAVIVNNNTTEQVNSAVVTNSLYESAVTGDNSASKNTGGDATISTGDANVTGTIISSVNTNVAGVAVSEFNVVNDTTGDVILDFGSGCTINCGSLAGATIKNTGNGVDSTNTTNLDVTNNNLTSQLNDAVIVNNMGLSAVSGNNETDKNTGGNSNITTGDANVAANLLNFANNNIAGNVVYAVVNIFSNLIGDIIFPESSFASCCGATDVTLANTNNGVGSNNTTTYSNEITDSATQINNLSLENNLIFDANSGGNETKGNTGGNSSINTGNTSIDANTVNIANNNLAGQNLWLVIVNEAGKWIGKILGSPDGTSFAGSSDFEFIVDENGGVTVANAGNGANSTNNASYNETNNNTLLQVNNAKVINNVDLSANTGGNSASKNTNGDSSIVTGDASIVANIVNFVNNNITGGGKMFITVVNVFGSWVGDFIGPGFKKEEVSVPELAASSPVVGGANVNIPATNQTNSNNSSNQTSNNLGGTIVSQTISLITPQYSGFITKVLGNKTKLTSSEVLGSSSNVNAKKVVNINFAWLLAILFPIGVISMIFRRRFAIKRVLTSILVLLLLVSSVRPFIPYVLAEEIVISGNGSGSTNTAEVAVTAQTTINQTNNADVSNNVTTLADTGSNSLNNNTAGEVSVTTGDITESVNVTNKVNDSTVDNSCCQTNDFTASISGNGSNSENIVNLNVNNENNVDISQTAEIQNKIVGIGNTGDNTANNNTGGNVTIDTGDIKVTGGINNGLINSFLIKTGINSGGFLASISGNGEDSSNTINANLGEVNKVDAENNYFAYNFVDWDLNTGGNEANGNTGGNIVIKTGNIFFDFLISNIANIGHVNINCCGIYDPGDEDNDDEDDTDNEVTPPADNGGNNNSESNSSVGGSSASSAGPAILGLSFTSSK